MRELDNVIEHTMILAEGDHIALKDLPASIVTSSQANPVFTYNLKDASRRFWNQHITRVLDQVGQDRREAAKLLDISLSSLYRKIKTIRNRLTISGYFASHLLQSRFFCSAKLPFQALEKKQHYFPRNRVRWVFY